MDLLALRETCQEDILLKRPLDFLSCEKKKEALLTARQNHERSVVGPPLSARMLPPLPRLLPLCSSGQSPRCASPQLYVKPHRLLSSTRSIYRRPDISSAVREVLEAKLCLPGAT